MTRHYLDHASASPLRPGVVEAMEPWFSAADPGRVHTEGRMARAALEEARDQVASLLGCRSSREVVFTSGGTEAIVTACAAGLELRPDGVLVAPVEHSSVRRGSERWADRVVDLPVDGRGRIDVDTVRQAADDTTMVHCQWGNHEVGTLQPVAEIVAAGREAGSLVHVDAGQAAGHVAVDFAGLGADLMSVSAPKLGGPRGVGCLLVRRGLRLPPLMVGGDQERARRAGLENLAGAIGFGAACAHAADHLVGEETENRRLLSGLIDGATSVAGVRLFTPAGDADRLPHIACFGVDGIEAEPVLLGLDQAGVAVHSGSSCSSESLEPSPVLEAMGVDAERSLRVSLGWSSTSADVVAFVDTIPGVVSRLRSLRS